MRHSIGQPLSNDALQRRLGPLDVAAAQRDPVIVPKIELGNVAMQVLLGAMLIDALHAALEDAVIVLDGVRVDLAADVLLGAVDREIVGGEVISGNCSRGRAAVQAGTAIGWPRSVRRMASMARTERRRAVSMTDLMSA